MQYPSTFPLILEKLNRLSFQATGYSSPNPPVACVITDLEGNILSEGHTQRTGENHAEREAYQHFAQKYPNAKNIPHLVFVTLEPCTHFGKTPPCLDLILEYKPVCVYFGLTDPNPLVRKKDVTKEYELAGVKVIESPEIAKISRAFLSGFISRIKRERPQIIIKSALSKEGFYADLSRTKISLSNPFSNQITQMLRAKLDAVIVGPVTVYVDYPGLDFRGFDLNMLDKLDLVKEKGNQFSNELFPEFLFKGISSRTSLDWHNQNEKACQPYRIFVISLKRLPDKSFFQKQSMLCEKYGNKKTIFFMLDFDRENVAHQKVFAKMVEVSSELPVLVQDRNELPEKLFSMFSKLCLNTILVEGGNMLYKIFANELYEGDLICLIHTSVSIKEGISPDIDFTNRKKKYEKKIDTDIWEVYGE